ncbi:MAG: MoaD/ThiS family protein [Firmicutes bacterium]|nr:MoaD/ThiS family protein [Bacillota bacterium]
MKVSIKLYSFIKDAAGVSKESIEINEGTTLAGLLDFLVSRYGRKFKEAILKEGRLNPHIKIFCSEKLINKNDLSLMLEEGNEILMFPPVSGG